VELQHKGILFDENSQ